MPSSKGKSASCTSVPVASPQLSLMGARSHLASPALPPTRAPTPFPEASCKHVLELGPMASWPRMTVRCVICSCVCYLFFSVYVHMGIQRLPPSLSILCFQAGALPLDQVRQPVCPCRPPVSTSTYTTSCREAKLHSPQEVGVGRGFPVCCLLAQHSAGCVPSQRPVLGCRARNWSQISKEEIKSKKSRCSWAQECWLCSVFPLRTLVTHGSLTTEDLQESVVVAAPAPTFLRHVLTV